MIDQESTLYQPDTHIHLPRTILHVLMEMTTRCLIPSNPVQLPCSNPEHTDTDQQSVSSCVSELPGEAFTPLHRRLRFKELKGAYP